MQLDRSSTATNAMPLAPAAGEKPDALTSSSASLPREEVIPLGTTIAAPVLPTIAGPASTAADGANGANGDLRTQVAALREQVTELTRALQIMQTSGGFPGGMYADGPFAGATAPFAAAESSLMGAGSMLRNESLGEMPPDIQQLDAFYAAQTGEPLP